MAYMYMICKKDDLAQGYIGQARGAKDALDRIYQHIAGAYKIPYKIHFRYKKDRYGVLNESSKFLLDEISTLGACSFRYLINSNAHTCYGVGAKSYNEFRKYWTFKDIGGGGMGDASREDAEKLDFAEFVYIYKYKSKLGGSQRAGSQSSFYYLTEPLIKKIEKVRNKNKELKDTWATLIDTLKNINEKVAWSSQKTANADKILENEKDLLYPESKVLGYAFEKSMINFIMTTSQVKSIIKRAAGSKEVLKKVGKDAEKKLNKMVKKVKFTFTGIKTAEGTLASIVESDMQKYINENKSKWEEAFKSLGYGNCTINIPDGIVASKANSLISVIKKISIPITDTEEQYNIDWAFDKDSITVTLSNPPEPTWYSEAEDFLHGFNKDVTSAVRTVCINNYKVLYQEKVEGQLHPSDSFKMLFEKAPFILNNWYQFFDPLMNALQEAEKGPLSFENFAKDPNKYIFTRTNVIDYFNNLVYLGIVTPEQMDDMLKYQNVAIW